MSNRQLCILLNLNLWGMMTIFGDFGPFFVTITVTIALNCDSMWQKLRHESIGCLDRSYMLWNNQNRAQPAKIGTFWPFFGDFSPNFVTITVTMAPGYHVTWQYLSNESIYCLFRSYTLLITQNGARWAKIVWLCPFWALFGALLSKFCHNNCHNAIRLSFHVTKVKTLVHRM